MKTFLCGGSRDNAVSQRVQNTLKLSTNINVLHRYAKSKRGLYRAYTSIGFIRRRIQKKEKALRKIEAAKKMEERQKQMVDGA